MQQDQTLPSLSLGTPIGFYIKTKMHKSQTYANFEIYTGRVMLIIPTVQNMGLEIGVVVEDLLLENSLPSCCRFYRVSNTATSMPNIRIFAFVQQIQEIKAQIDIEEINEEIIESNIVRCPDPVAAKNMEQRILDIKSQKDSVGGIVRCVCLGVPAGLGQPCFDKLEADFAKAVLGIPTTKGFSIGSGFDKFLYDWFTTQ